MFTFYTHYKVKEMTRTGQVTLTGEMRNMNRTVTREIFTEVPGLDGTVFKLDLKMTLDDRCEWSNLAQIGSTNGR
jgi:hypothetical protein